MNEKLLKYFEVLNENDKIGHAFLIANTSYNNLKDTLERVFSDYFFHNNLKIDENADVFFIDAVNDTIKKEAIVSLHEFLNNTSQISGKKVYIINRCEQMNPTAANRLLKILEEPSDNIYAFLITTNINNVLSTIKSRCQCLFISTDVSSLVVDEVNEENFKKATDFINIIESKGDSSFAYMQKVFGKKIDKQECVDILKKVEVLYKNILNIKIGKALSDNVFESIINDIKVKSNEEEIIKMLIIIDKCIQTLNYNLNSSLVLDKLLIDLGRC